MWEAAKTSGALIGVEPSILARIDATYTALQANFGYTEIDFHHALAKDFRKFGTLEEIMDASYRLEGASKLKLLLLDSSYIKTVDMLEEYLK